MKWSIHSVSVCHCQPGHQRASSCEGRLRHKEVKIFPVFQLPAGEASCQKIKNKKWHEQRDKWGDTVSVNDSSHRAVAPTRLASQSSVSCRSHFPNDWTEAPAGALWFLVIGDISRSRINRTRCCDSRFPGRRSQASSSTSAEQPRTQPIKHAIVNTVNSSSTQRTQNCSRRI